MRDVLPIAFVEHIQSANWPTTEIEVSAYDICDRIVPIRQRLENPELDLDGLTSVGFVRDFSSEIASAITGGKQDNFRNPDGWLSFLEELTIESNLEDIPYSESGAYILSQLFWHHFTTFRLLTAWLIVDAFGRRLGEGGLSISLRGAGTLLSDLSGGGPPIFDVENMRGNFPDTYR